MANPRRCCGCQGGSTGNSRLRTVAEPHKDAATLVRGSQSSGPQAARAVCWQQTGMPCHAGRSRLSIRTPPRTIRIASWSSHHAPSPPQVFALVRRAVLVRSRSLPSNTRGSSVRFRTPGQCGVVCGFDQECCVVPHSMIAQEHSKTLRSSRFKPFFQADPGTGRTTHYRLARPRATRGWTRDREAPHRGRAASLRDMLCYL